MPEIKESQEIKSLIPRMSGTEYDELKESIKYKGVKIPIDITPDGTILDGYTRYQICKELGIEPKTRVVHLQDSQNPIKQKIWALTVNVKRRQLNDFQKSELAKPLLELEQKLAEQRQKSGTSASKEAKGKSAAKVAKQIGVSRSTFERALSLDRYGKPDLIEKLRTGKVTIGNAWEQVRKQMGTEPPTFSEIEKVERLLSNTTCPQCGDTHLTWTCTHGHSGPTSVA